MTTMDIVQSSDGINSMRFRVKENWTELSFGTIGSLLGFGHYLTVNATLVRPDLVFDPDYTVEPR